MNGEFLELFNMLTESADKRHARQEKREDQRHNENLGKFKDIFGQLGNLNCKAHMTQLRIQWYLIAFVIIGQIVYNWLNRGA